MAQPLQALGRLCREHDALLYVDATATLGGMDLQADGWNLDVVSAGLQKCMGGPSGSAPLTLNDRAEEKIVRRRHVEKGLQDSKYQAGDGPVIRSNYFDLAMIMDYWSDKALNHHTEATTMLYAARECARVVLQEGLQSAVARHARISKVLTDGLRAMGLELFGDQAHKMPNVTGVYIPRGVDGDAVRRAMLEEHNIEIGTSFGPLHGRIWRIGTMGYNAREDAVERTLRALKQALARQRG
jgi:(S)-ureidoglycine-glyoxylate aminotransferase